jgi:WD40 repeat protein
VTAVAALGSELLCSGGADGVVRGWDGKCTAVVDFAAHEDGVNDLVSLPGGPHNSAAGTDLQLLSCGKDRTARLWALQQQDSTGGGSSSKRSSVQCLAVCEAHTDAVQCVAASPAGGVCASGGWDGQLLMWRVGALHNTRHVYMQ